MSVFDDRKKAGKEVNDSNGSDMGHAQLKAQLKKMRVDANELVDSIKLELNRFCNEPQGSLLRDESARKIHRLSLGLTYIETEYDNMVKNFKSDGTTLT